jgi:hypothetical protein
MLIADPVMAPVLNLRHIYKSHFFQAAFSFKFIKSTIQPHKKKYFLKNIKKSIKKLRIIS